MVSTQVVFVFAPYVLVHKLHGTIETINCKSPIFAMINSSKIFFWFFLLMLLVMEVSFFHFWVKASRYIFPYAIQTLLRISWIQVHIRLISDCKVLLYDKIIIKELLFAIDKLNWC